MKNHLILTLSMLALLSSPTLRADNLYTSGHGDIGVAYEDPGEFFLHGHLGGGAVVNGVALEGEGEEFAPEDFTTVVPDGQKFTGGLPATYDPIGSAGQFWYIDAVQKAGVPFFGFATEELDPSDWIGPITFTLTTVVSPGGTGNFAAWSNDAFGNPVFDFSTFDPSATRNGNNTLRMNAGSHAHYSMSFTEAGLWQVGFTVSGQHVTDGLVTGSGTFNFAVAAVPEPASTAVMVAAGLAVLVMVRRKRARH